jgi:hypothetical protein
VGKTRAATGRGSAEDSARANRVESDTRWSHEEKEGGGCGKERGEIVEDIEWVVSSSSWGWKGQLQTCSGVSKNHLDTYQHSFLLANIFIFFNFNLNIRSYWALIYTRYSTCSTYKYNVAWEDGKGSVFYKLVLKSKVINILT